MGGVESRDEDGVLVRDIDWLSAGIAILLVVVVSFVIVLLCWVGYYAATGGFTYTDKRNVGGITCIAVHDRLTGEVKSVSCPPIQP